MRSSWLGLSRHVGPFPASLRQGTEVSEGQVSQRGTEEDVWTYHSWTASQRGKDPANLPAVGTGHTANSFPTQVGLGEEGNIDRHIQ